LIFFGWLSDIVGRKPVILGGMLLAAITYYPLYSWLGAVTRLRQGPADRKKCRLSEVEEGPPGIVPSLPNWGSGRAARRELDLPGPSNFGGCDRGQANFSKGTLEGCLIRSAPTLVALIGGFCLCTLFGMASRDHPAFGAMMVLGLIGLSKLMNQFEIRRKSGRSGG
jgi:MFS family permease